MGLGARCVGGLDTPNEADTAHMMEYGALHLPPTPPKGLYDCPMHALCDLDKNHMSLSLASLIWSGMGHYSVW